jgi:hypothetical protein
MDKTAFYLGKNFRINNGRFVFSANFRSKDTGYLIFKIAHDDRGFDFFKQFKDADKNGFTITSTCLNSIELTARIDFANCKLEKP